MQTVLLVFLGGGIGSVLRYAAGFLFTNVPIEFPLQTLFVNALGSLLIGILWGLGHGGYFNDYVKFFVFVGILGGFTTFSSFSLETLKLLENRAFFTAFNNILLNTIVSISLCFVGYYTMKQ
jgi:CrcB protein